MSALGALHHVASSGASAMSSSGTIDGAAWTLAVPGTPSEIHVVPADGMRSGTVNWIRAPHRALHVGLCIAAHVWGDWKMTAKQTTFA